MCFTWSLCLCVERCVSHSFDAFAVGVHDDICCGVFFQSVVDCLFVERFRASAASRMFFWTPLLCTLPKLSPGRADHALQRLKLEKCSFPIRHVRRFFGSTAGLAAFPGARSRVRTRCSCQWRFAARLRVGVLFSVRPVS